MSRREELCQAALKAFSDKGYTKTSVSDIVKEVGVAQGTFYNYFSSKKDIFLTLMEDFFQRMATRVNSIDPTSATTKEEVTFQVNQLYLAIFATYEENRPLAKIVMREAAVIDVDFEKKLDEFYALLINYVQTYLESGQESGLIRDYDPTVVTYAIIGMAESVAHNLIVKGNRTEIDLLSTSMAEFECHGLLK